MVAAIHVLFVFLSPILAMNLFLWPVIDIDIIDN